MLIALINCMISLFFIAAIVWLFSLIVPALLTYIRFHNIDPANQEIKKTLGETIKQHRMRCKMTQEFVAPSLNVSRQAVSKWESGVSDPSTSNLLALAKLFEISAHDLLNNPI